MKHRYFVLALALSAFALAACSEKETYTPGPKADGFHFSNDVNSAVIEVDESMNGVDVFLYRSKTDAAESKTVTIVDESGLFFATNPTTVNVAFAAGEGKKAIRIPFAFAELKPGKEYPIEFSFTGGETPYGPSKLNVSILSPLPWILFDKGVIYETNYWGEEEEKELYYQQISETIRFCKLSECFGHDTIEGGNDYDVQDYTWYWNTETNEVYVPLQYMGYTNSNGQTWFGDETSFYDAYWNAQEAGKNGSGAEVGSAEWFAFCDAFRAKYPRPADYYPYYDGNGVFYLADGYFAGKPGTADYLGDYLSAGTGKYDSFVCASFPDLELEASYRGMFVDPEGNAVPIIDFAGGADLEVIKYAITDQDTDADETLAKLVAEDESLEVVGTAEFVDGAATIMPELEPGVYRLVAVPYVAADKEDPYKTNNAIAFDFYFSGINTEIPEVEARAMLLDVTDVFEQNVLDQYGMTTYNAIGFWIVGNEIKTCTTLMAPTSAFASFGGISEDLVLEYGQEFDAEDLADVNSQYGYASAFTKLSAETEYTFGVVLTNVYGASLFITDTHSTTAIPYEGDVVLGDYLIGEDGVFTLAATDEENHFLVQNLLLENNTEFNAIYDPDALTLTLDGTEYGYEEQYGNNFGGLYGYANAAKTVIYGYFAGTSGEGPLVFKVDETSKEICQMVDELSIELFQNAEGYPYAGSLMAYEAGSTVALIPEASGAPAKPASAAKKSFGTLKLRPVTALDNHSHKAINFPAYAPKGSGDWSTPARKVVKISLEKARLVSPELK